MRVDDFETDAALARLARNTVLGLRSLADRHLDVTELAFERFLKICRPRGPIEHARRFFETRMLGILKEARLTINFNADTWFGNGKEPARVLNMFDRSHKPSHNPDVVGARSLRNKVEMEFADYAARARKAPRVREAQGARQLVARYGATRIDDTGLPTSPDFRSAVRPRYGALDFAYCQGGGAGGHRYGRSFLVLKEHIKHASTYIYTDSFKVNNDLALRRNEYGGKLHTLHDAVATYFHLEKVLLYCTARMLTQIYAYASGERPRGSRFCLPPDTTGYMVTYIEFHALTDIRFDRDIAAMVISRSEIRDSFLGLPWYAEERHIREFARDHSIRLSFVA